MKKQWSHSVNTLKLVASFFVVTIHCQFPGQFGQIVKDFAQFSVPLFFMISGYFTYSESEDVLRNRCKKKIPAVLLMIIWSNILFLFYNVGKMCIQGQNSVHIWTWLKAQCDIEHMIWAVTMNASLFSTHLWYLQALLYCYILSFALFRKRKEKMVYVCFIMMLAMHFVYNFTELYQVQMVRNAWFEGMPAFAIGMCLSQNSEKWKGCRPSYTLLFFFAGVCVLMVERVVAPYRVLYVGNMISAIGIFLFAIMNKVEKENVVSFLGRCISGNIYILHPIYIYIVFKIFDKLRCSENRLYEWTHPILTWVATACCAYGIYQLKSYFAKKLVSGRGKIIRL